MTRAFARHGFTLIVERIDQYHENADHLGVEIGVLLGAKKVGHLYGYLGNGKSGSLYSQFSMALRAVPEYDGSWTPGTFRRSEGFHESKWSKCEKGRPKIRRWAVYCAKKFREYMSVAVMPDVVEVTDS